jgi:hypothetical protein
MFCAPGLVFGSNDGVWSRFHVLRARTRFLLHRGCRDPFTCFAVLNSFSTVPTASVPVFMFYAARLVFGSTDGVGSRPILIFCAPGLIFGGTVGVDSRFPVLHARTRFRRHQWRRVPFSCIAGPDTFSALMRASGSVFMFCAPGLIFGRTEGVGSHFHVLRAWTRFGR